MNDEEIPRRQRKAVVPPKEATLPMVFTAVLDFREEVLDVLDDISDKISLLFRRTDLHSKVLRKIRRRTHAERNAISIIALRQDQLERRVDEIDHKGVDPVYDELVEELTEAFNDPDTAPLPPPEDDAEAEGD